MKRFLSFFISFLVVMSAWAQSPTCFNWQGIIRDGAGKALENKPVALELLLLQDTTSAGKGEGPVIYFESHNAVTNQFGLVNVQVGCGKPVFGRFSDLDWGTRKYWLSIRANVDGKGLVDIGKSPILPVAGALWARHSGDWVNVGDSIIYTKKRIGINTEYPLYDFQLGDGDTKSLAYEVLKQSPNIGIFRFGDYTGWRLHFGRMREMFLSPKLNSGTSGSFLTIVDNGKIGISNSDPAYDLQIGEGTAGSIGYERSLASPHAGAIRFGDNTGWKLYIGRMRNDNQKPDLNYGNQGAIMTIVDNGKIGINTINPAEMLDVNGTTRTKILEITGGSDLTEGFDIHPLPNATPEPGMLLSIDPANPGKLMVSAEPYDKKLAGVISGANGIEPGMRMRQQGTIAYGNYPVTLTGRVYVKADAAFGAIQPGDLLTSSSVPGFAMKVTDYAQAQGAVIGKAMTGLAEGQGYVLVLVALQ